MYYSSIPDLLYADVFVIYVYVEVLSLSPGDMETSFISII